MKKYRDEYPEYKAWGQMKQRCYNANNSKFKQYGGRGIKVCDRWRNSFEAFLEDMGLRPGKGYSLNRKDNDKGYSKNNCEWVTAKVQMRNQTVTRWITYKGRKQSVMDWAEELGFNDRTLRKRLNAGWSVKRVLETPIIEPWRRHNNRFIVFNGVKKPATIWARDLGISRTTLFRRLNQGWSAVKAIAVALDSVRSNSGEKSVNRGVLRNNAKGNWTTTYNA